MTVVSSTGLARALGIFPPTAEQAAVIEAPLTPAVVVAGAGSGKTETMAARVVWLVANDLVSRERVLGLTFTRKAAGELAERISARLARLDELSALGLVPYIDSLAAAGDFEPIFALEQGKTDFTPRGIQSERLRILGALAAKVGSNRRSVTGIDIMLDRPTVMTYNSFADSVLKDNAVRVGADMDATVQSESAAWLLMRRIVLRSDDDRLVELDKSVTSLTDAALRIARDASDNLAQLDDIAAFGRSFARLADLPSGKRGGAPYAPIAGLVHDVGALDVLVGLARQYIEAKKQLGLIDFSDQVAGAVIALRQHPIIGDELRERFHVVLLDEYQDTSVVQTELLATAFVDSGVMAVGDPHQAIYGWRGASAGNLGGFASAFTRETTCAHFALSTSWRNSQNVLRAANAVIAPLNATVPIPVETLQSRQGAPEGQVDFAYVGDVEEEAQTVAEWFDNVRSDNRHGGVLPSGAILFRTKRHMTRFADALAERGIPHRILGLGGLLSTPEVVDIVSMLRVIHDPGAGSALIRLLTGPRWQIGAADVKRLNHLARRMSRSAPSQAGTDEGDATASAPHAEDKLGLIDALDAFARFPADHVWFQGFSDVARDRLTEAAGTIRYLRRTAAESVADTIRAIERELRLDVELAANNSRGSMHTALAQVRAFTHEVNSFLSTQGDGSLSQLLAWLDHAEEADEFQAKTEPAEPGVVQLLTIHASKGLEWDAVCVVRMVDGELPANPRSSKGWLSFGVLPFDFRGDRGWLPELAWQDAETQKEFLDDEKNFKEANADRQLEEETRLGYVALTRAKEHLLLTGSPWAGTKRPRDISRFFTRAAAALEVTVDEPDAPEDPLLGRSATLEWPMDPLAGRRARVEKAAITVRDAVASEPDEDIALLLQERKELGSPPLREAPKRIPASRFKDFVTDFSGTLEQLYRPMPERPYTQTQTGTHFHSWVEHRSGLSGFGRSTDDSLWELEPEEPDASSRRDETLDLLIANFEASEWATLKPIAVETEIDFPLDAGDTTHVVVSKIDAVYERDGRTEIVDWKTGRPPRTEAERDERMLQLALYSVAYHRATGVPLDQIDAVLFYVADNLILRQSAPQSEDELAQRLIAARTARS